MNTNGTVTFTTLRNMTTGDSKQDYVFPYGQTVTLIFAALNSATFNYHNKYGFIALKFDQPSATDIGYIGGISSVDLVVENPSLEFYTNHGWWMWASWGTLSYFMLASKRYMRFFSWQIGQAIHSIFGYFITFVTLVWAFRAIANIGWKSKPSYHTVLGLIMLSTILLVSFSGMS